MPAVCRWMVRNARQLRAQGSRYVGCARRPAAPGSPSIALREHCAFAANHTPGCAQLQGVIVFPLLHYSANPCESLKAKSPRELTPRGQQELQALVWGTELKQTDPSRLGNTLSPQSRHTSMYIKSLCGIDYQSDAVD